jgi:hypothetical protein
MIRISIVIALAATACTARNAYVYPKAVQSHYLITAGDTPRPYQSLGYLQVSKSGANLFGFLSIVDADLNALFGDILVPELEKAGADGIINLRFEETQHVTATKILFAFPLFFIPLPTHVEATGEMIRFLPAPPVPRTASLPSP